jgi:hypothetical protein
MTLVGLGRILRLLASRHIFREVAPDVFANNRLSSMLDTGKSVAEIVAEYGFALVVLSNTTDVLERTGP